MGSCSNYNFIFFSHSRKCNINGDHGADDNLIKIKKRKSGNSFRRISAKLNKDAGKEYVTAQGVSRPSKSMRPPCGAGCRYNCSEKINDRQRQKLFDAFYNLGIISLQWKYIAMHTEKQLTKQRSRTQQTDGCAVRRERKPNVKYYLDVKANRVRVCRFMFEATFDISHSNVHTAMLKTDLNGDVIDVDRRGYHKKTD